MPSFLTAHRGEESAMPRVFQIALRDRPESETELPSIRLESQTRHADCIYRTRWFEGFRQRWLDALKREHLNFVARLASVGGN
jgi:hypothetical protein